MSRGKSEPRFRLYFEAPVGLAANPHEDFDVPDTGHRDRHPTTRGREQAYRAWRQLAKAGGLFFTDPYYPRPYWKRGPKEMDECVYYLAPDRKAPVRIISDLKQPNGIIGTPNGKTLYVADIGASRTYRYRIHHDGSVTAKTL